MKTKRRHHRSSSEESDVSDDSEKSSSSDSESEQSSTSEKRYKKKKKRAESSDSESDSDDHRRSNKRKHKKKKKKHVKRKRRSDSVANSASDADRASSRSEGEVSPSLKKKHKKHKQKHGRSSSVSIIDDDHKQRKLHSVVKERRRSSEDRNHPQHTYYQKEYPQRSVSPVDEYEREREREVQRFYRGSSKEQRFQEQYHYEREREERIAPILQEKYHKNVVMSQISSVSDSLRQQRPQRDYQRSSRFEGHRSPEEFNRRKREETYYHSREDSRGFNRYNQHEDRHEPPKRQFDNGREFRDRRQQETERFRPPEREFPERRDRFRDDPTHTDRSRDVRRERPPPRPDRPPHQHHPEPQRSASVERYRDRSRRSEREERMDRDTRSDRERDRPERDVRPDRERDVRPDRDRDNRPDRDRDIRPDRDRDIRPDRDREARPDRSARPERDARPDRDRRADMRHDRHSNEQKPRGKKSRFDPEEGKEFNWGKTEIKKEGDNNTGEKEKPNFGLSGKLTADANTVNGVVIKYTEPDDAKQPKRRWRFYPFKGDKALPILYIHRQSAFLIGRDKKVADIALEHPSISKQHAALQYRATPFTRPDGSQGRRVRPYIIDLESANGTFVNNKKIEPRRYVELLERDVVKFGFSQREYVLLHENSKDDAQDDDNQDQPATAEHIKQEKRIKQELAADGE